MMSISDAITKGTVRLIDEEDLTLFQEELTRIPHMEIDIAWEAFASIIEAFADDLNLVVEDGPYGPASLTIFAEDDLEWD